MKEQREEKPAQRGPEKETKELTAEELEDAAGGRATRRVNPATHKPTPAPDVDITVETI